jgi:hypothetical protein
MLTSRLSLIAASLAAAALTLSASASTGGPFELSFFTIDCGGGTSSAGAFAVTATIGQPDAASTALSGGAFSIVGGFIPAASGATAPEPCPADFDGNGIVNGLDLAQLLGQWSGASFYSPCPPHKPQDLNVDCKVNGLDLALLLGAWGPCN